jgi:hypothetical protein
MAQINMDPRTKTLAKQPEASAPVPEPAPPVNVASAMHGRMVAAAASRNALLAARLRVENAKREADRISLAIRIEEQKKADLKSELSRAIDEMEAAVQAHDTATRADQATRAISAE